MPPKKKSYTYPYPRPSVTVDLVAFTFLENRMHVLVIKRKSPPFEGMLALPGGFLDMDEEPAEAVARETREETGLELTGPIFQLGFYGAVDREPRGRTISLVHSAVIRSPAPDPVGGDDAAEASWVPIGTLAQEPMAFDHSEILEHAAMWLDRLTQAPQALNAFLPEIFVPADVRALLTYFGWPGSDTDTWCERAIEAGLCERLPGRKKQYLSLVEDATELRRAELTE